MAKKKKDSNKYKKLFQHIAKFGKLVAEEDSKLNRYYIGREKYVDKALDYEDPVNFFVGPKGIGKSAILQMIRLEKSNCDKSIINITPDDLAFSALANIQATNPLLSDATKQQWLFKSLWDYVLLMEIWTRESPRDQRFMWFKKYWSNKDEKRLERLFNITFDKNGNPKNNTFTDRILQLIDEIEFSCGEIGGKIKLSESDKYAFLSEINNAAKVLPSKLKNKYYILIDDLDLYWKNEPSQNALIASLFVSIKKLSSNQIKFIVSIREDIFAKLPIQDKDKMRDKVCNIFWSNDLLKQMVTTRIECIIGKCEETVIWGDLFPENTFEKIQKKSTLKPREIIRFIHLCIEYATKNTHKRVQESDVNEALLAYSKERIADIDSEYNYVYPKLNHVIMKFYGKTKEFEFKLIKDIAEELALERMDSDTGQQPWNWVGYFDTCPDKFALILLEIGFLQIKVNRTAIPEDYNYSLHGSINENKWFAVHSMYRNALQLLGN